MTLTLTGLGLWGGSCRSLKHSTSLLDAPIPENSIDTTIKELGPKNHNSDGLLGRNSIMVAGGLVSWL